MACLGKNKKHYYIKEVQCFRRQKRNEREKTGRKGGGKEEANKDRKNVKKKESLGNKAKKKG